jgi:hypothetical protein
MTPSNIEKWWDFLIHAPLSLVLLSGAVTLLYVTYKFLLHVVNEIRATLQINLKLRDELVRKLDEREAYITELESIVDEYRKLLVANGVMYAQDKRTRSGSNKTE